MQTQIANLLNIRLQSYVKLFLNTGADYFGLIQTKNSSETRRNQGTLKTYGVIFTCLNTRGIHIELSVDLLTDSFTLSLRRFLARRRHVNTIQSNNETNFIGAVKEFNDVIKYVKYEKITIYLNKHHKVAV